MTVGLTLESHQIEKAHYLATLLNSRRSPQLIFDEPSDSCNQRNRQPSNSKQSYDLNELFWLELFVLHKSILSRIVRFSSVQKYLLLSFCHGYITSCKVLEAYL